MNQSILFPDQQTYNVAREAVAFPAQSSGALISCFVSVDWLQRQTGNSLNAESEVLAAFNQCRFDLEDAAEAAIEDEDFNQQGEVWIS
uniref:Uncharacterized protein n=1 Tax=uncultured Vibrionales bacterium HF0010_22E23 TaxID=710999 RepID=E0XRI6_9GAMM|nr:hypothetical protein [uncultured Vibrionales bacterium HF0010_22E23]